MLEEKRKVKKRIDREKAFRDIEGEGKVNSFFD